MRKTETAKEDLRGRVTFPCIASAFNFNIDFSKAHLSEACHLHLIQISCNEYPLSLQILIASSFQYAKFLNFIHSRYNLRIVEAKLLLQSFKLHYLHKQKIMHKKKSENEEKSKD